MVQSEDESAQGCRLVSGGTEGGIHRGAESSSSVLVERLSFQAMPILRLFMCSDTYPQGSLDNVGIWWEGGSWRVAGIHTGAEASVRF